MPVDDRFRFGDDERRTALRPDSCEPDPQQAVSLCQNGPARARPFQDMKLMPSASTSSCRVARDRKQSRSVKRSEIKTAFNSRAYSTVGRNINVVNENRIYVRDRWRSGSCAPFAQSASTGC